MAESSRELFVADHAIAKQYDLTAIPLKADSAIVDSNDRLIAAVLPTGTIQKLKTTIVHDGQATLESLGLSQNVDQYRLAPPAQSTVTKVTQASHARVGIMGNPSDGYGGKTLSSTIENFRAVVELEASPTVVFVPNPIGDANEFSDVNDLVRFAQRNGYDGGIRLLMATTKTFWDALRKEKILLSSSAKARGFKMRYSTNVPRQLGLAGSSAICTAAFRGLMRWFDVPATFIPPERLAGYVLSAEQKELGIAAGLQDRVSQAFDCPVFMDFTPEAFALNNNKYGRYVALPKESVEFFRGKLFLMFPRFTPESLTNSQEDDGAKSSGKVHSPVRKKWEEGDVFTRTTMSEIAALAEKGRDAVLQNDEKRFVSLMNENFALRLKLFGAAVSPVDRALIDFARTFGEDVGAKLPGSGGAILCFCPRGKDFETFIRSSGRAEIVPLSLRQGPNSDDAKL